jgi:hypothetical protein
VTLTRRRDPRSACQVTLTRRRDPRSACQVTLTRRQDPLARLRLTNERDVSATDRVTPLRQAKGRSPSLRHANGFDRTAADPVAFVRVTQTVRVALRPPAPFWLG